MVWRGVNGVLRAVPVSEALLPDPGKLSANRIGIFPSTFRQAGDQPLGAFVALNDHVLPQGGVFIGVLGIAEEAQKSISMPSRLSPSLVGPEAQISRRNCSKSSRLSTSPSLRGSARSCMTGCLVLVSLA